MLLFLAHRLGFGAVHPASNTRWNGWCWLTHTHSMRWYPHYDTTGAGHLYRGQFKPLPVQTNAHPLIVCRYVERNVLLAGRVERAAAWRWGSLRRRQSGTAEQRALLSDWPTGGAAGLVVDGKPAAKPRRGGGDAPGDPSPCAVRCGDLDAADGQPASFLIGSLIDHMDSSHTKSNVHARRSCSVFVLHCDRRVCWQGACAVHLQTPNGGVVVPGVI